MLWQTVVSIGVLGVSLLWTGESAGAAGRTDGRVAQQPPVDRSGARELHPDLLKKTIQKYLEGEWNRRAKAVHVALLEPSEPVKIPSGVIELRVAPSSFEEGLGRRLFHVTVMAGGNAWTTIDALADVAAMVDVVVPNRYLKSEELIEAGDVTTQRIKVYDLNHPYLTDREEAVGKSAARPLQPDTPLRQSFLKTPMTIKKGDRVLIEAKRGGLSIQTSGVTKSGGHIGQSIMVVNIDSGRELRAKIVAPGLVQVEF
jgi:flagella basal body P-ring formation protein FlgA